MQCPYVMFICYVDMFDAGVIPNIWIQKLIPMVMEVQNLNCEEKDISSSRKKEYLMVFCISQDKYSWPVTFTCTT